MNYLSFFKAQILLMGAVLLLLFGCGKIEEKLEESIGSYELPQIDEAQVLSQAENILEQNKGKAIVTGQLLKEGTLPGGLGKVSNAAGYTRFSGKDSLPLANADVLFYDALNQSTQSAYSTQTDSTGTYYAILDEGTYFAFAIKFDPISQELITARIDNIPALKDSVVAIENTTAIEDLTAPTVTSIHNATAPDANSGVFLVSDVPNKKVRINVSFSEPMDRSSSKAVIMGKMDTSSSASSFSITDTIPAASLAKIWNGDNTVLSIGLATEGDSLEVGVQYGILFPTSLKDIARNALDEKYKATFTPIEISKLAAFSVSETYPVDGGTVKPIQNPSIIFNRPADVFSVINAVSLDPMIRGIWEILGNKAVFKHREPLTPGTSYTMTVAATAADLLGNTLAGEKVVKFTVVEYSGAAASGGDKGDIALRVEDAFDAYQQGDIHRFGSYFHANFRINEGGTVLSRDQFIRNMRHDVARRNNLFAGFPAPIFDTHASVCSESGTIERWKVESKSGGNFLWVETNVPPGVSRQVYMDDADRTIIEDSLIQWDMHKPHFMYNGGMYGYDADFSSFNGPVSEDGANDDERFWGDLLANTSTVVLAPVKASFNEAFEVDAGIVVSGDTARVAVRNKETKTFSRLNYEPHRICDSSSEETHYGILLFVLVKKGTEWLIVFIDSPEDVGKDEYEGDVNYDNEFQDFDDFNRIKGFKLLGPVAEAEDVADAIGQIQFSFQRVTDTSVGGYLIGIAEDPRYIAGRPPFGGLIFVKQSDSSVIKFKIDSIGKPVSGSNATAIVRNIFDLRLPGWERTLFDAPIEYMVDHENGYAGVYYWKAIAIADTSAAQFLSNGFKPDRFFAESDFAYGPDHGHFSVGKFPDFRALEFIFSNQDHFGPGPGGPGGPGFGFEDADRDGYPDHMEHRYHTDAHNPSSFPDFSLDTDGDGMADFLEEMIDSTGADSLVEKKASDEQLMAQFQTLKTLFGIELHDSDGDGFPDEVEEMFGFDPHNPNHNPGTRARVEIPTGVFSGKLAFGPEQFDLTLKIIKDSVISVGYTAYIKADTLSDTVRAHFNQGAAELVFPIRFESGPDAGNSLLMRAFYDNFNSIFMGPMDMVPSVPKNEPNFHGGPYVGNWAATNKIGVDVGQFLGGPGGPGGPGPGPAFGPGPGGPGPGSFGYREPPPGTDDGWQFIFMEDAQKPMMVLIDDFGDTVAVFGNYFAGNSGSKMGIHPQPDGGFEIHGEFFTDSAMNHEEINVHGRVFPWMQPDSTGAPQEYWVFDGGFNTLSETCERVSSTDASMCIQPNFKDVPGQFSAKALRSAVVPSGFGNLEGTMSGWAKQDEFGTGFNVGPGPGPGPIGPDNDGDCVPSDRDPDDNNFDIPTPGGECNFGGPGPGDFFAPPYLGQGSDFRAQLLAKGISDGDTFNIRIISNERIVQSINDSNRITNSHEFECGFVRAYPLEDPEGKMSDSEGGWQIIILESSPGIPAYDDKVKDSSGNILSGGAFMADVRPVQGPQCEGGFFGGGPGPIGPGPGGPLPVPSELQGKDDFVGPGNAFEIWNGSWEDFKRYAVLYIGYQASDVFEDLQFPVQTERGDWAHTFGGDFESIDGVIAHPHNFPFFSRTDTWVVAESKARPGEPAISISHNGPSIILIPTATNDDVTAEFSPFRAPPFEVYEFARDIFGTDSFTIHELDSGSLINTHYLKPMLMSSSDFVVIEGLPGLDSGEAAVILASPNDPGRPAIGAETDGEDGILYRIMQLANLDTMSGGGPSIGDLDGDCVPSFEDPNDNDFNIPFFGGRCGPPPGGGGNPPPGGGPMFFTGTFEVLRPVLQISGGMVFVATGENQGSPANVGANPPLNRQPDGSISIDFQGKKLLFLASDNQQTMMIKDGIPVVIDASVLGGGNPPPDDPPPPGDSGAINPPPPGDSGAINPPPPGDSGAINPPPPGDSGAINPPPPGGDPGLLAYKGAVTAVAAELVKSSGKVWQATGPSTGMEINLGATPGLAKAPDGSVTVMSNGITLIFLAKDNDQTLNMNSGIPVVADMQSLGGNPPPPPGGNPPPPGDSNFVQGI